MYEPRFYRLWSADKDLVSFNVVVKETDLYIRAKRDLTEKAHEVVVQQRGFLEEYIRHHPGFATAMEPFPVENEAPDIVREMAEAAEKVSVGPMAAVAGAIAERVGRELLKLSPEVLVENGGDIFLKTLKKRRVGIYTGKPPFDGRVALEIRASETPLGVCTSSGTVGHSLSLGSADAVIVLAPSTALADAAATAIGNSVREEADIDRSLAFAQEVEGLGGVAIIKNDRMALWGKIRLVRT
jgi:hypothetical protein